MKVLHVIPSLGPLRGGPSFALPLLARGLARAGVHVDIVTTDDNGPCRLDVPLGEPIRTEGLTTWYFPRQTRFYNASWPLARWLACRLHEYDVIHTHALFSYSTTVTACLAARRRVPYIVRPLGSLNRWGMTHRRPRLKQLSYRLVERRILNGAAAVHHTSQQEQREAAAAGARGRSVVIPLGIDLSAFRQLPSPDKFRAAHPAVKGRRILLFLSRVDAKKGMDLLLPAFARVHRSHPEVVLVIAGDGEEGFMSRLRDEARGLGIAQHVVWPGFLAGEGKLSALSAAELFVLPSYSENFGLAVVEALAAGLPVVLSDQVGIAPEVQRARAGLVSPCDGDALAAALIRLCRDGELRRQTGQNAHQLAKHNFSIEATTHRLLALYEEVLGGTKAGAVEGARDE